jgi:hypothetical protein
LARKTKVPGRKTNEGLLLSCAKRIARMWPHRRKLADAGI